MSPQCNLDSRRKAKRTVAQQYDSSFQIEESFFGTRNLGKKLNALKQAYDKKLINVVEIEPSTHPSDTRVTNSVMDGSILEPRDKMKALSGMVSISPGRQTNRSPMIDHRVSDPISLT
jgi:hypothetical protein